MPETAAPTPPPVPFGQALGEAYRHAHALQLRLLDREHSSFLEWVVLNTIAPRSEPVSADDLSADLSRELSIDVSEVDDVVTALRSSGRLDVVTVDGVRCLALSDDGRRYHQRLRASIGRASAELLEAFDPADIATTVKVLTAVRQRAPLVATGS